VLYSSLAKGADRAVKIPGDWSGFTSAPEAQIFASLLSSDPDILSSDTLILTGSQAIDDLVGENGAYLANEMNLPYLGVITSVSIDPSEKRMTVIKEFSGGLLGEFQVPLPAVLGIQAAEKPPRYVPVAKIRAAMKMAEIETLDAVPPDGTAAYTVMTMRKREVTGKAEMLEGTPEEISRKIGDILSNTGVI
jgi:electron transfer flavoprotein beta subunit